jgi:hypothetical protein
MLVVAGVASVATAIDNGEPMDVTPPALLGTDVSNELAATDTAALAGAASPQHVPPTLPEACPTRNASPVGPPPGARRREKRRGGGGGPARRLALEYGRRAEADPVRWDEALRALLGVDRACSRRELLERRGRCGHATRERLALCSLAPAPEAEQQHEREEHECNEHAEGTADDCARARPGRRFQVLRRVVAASRSRQRA